MIPTLRPCLSVGENACLLGAPQPLDGVCDEIVVRLEFNQSESCKLLKARRGLKLTNQRAGNRKVILIWSGCFVCVCCEQISNAYIFSNYGWISYLKNALDSNLGALHLCTTRVEITRKAKLKLASKEIVLFF